MANQPAKHASEGAMRPSETFLDYLARRASEDSENRAYEVAAQQLDRILAAESEQDMWNADNFESVGGRDLVDVEQRVNSFTVHESGDAFNAPLNHYVIVQSTRLSDGTPFVWNTGAPLVIGKLRWLEAAEKLGTPEADCVVRGTDTPKGTVLKLKPIPARAVTAEVS